MIAWLLVGAALLGALARVFRGRPEPDFAPRVMWAHEVAFLTAAADATFPPGGAVPPSGSEAGVPAYVDRWLEALDPRTRALMRALFFLVEHATLVLPAPGRLGFRRFSSLSFEQQVAALEGWRRSRLPLRRLVAQSLRAIVTMGYFAHPPVLRQLGLAPKAIPTPVCEADLLYPPVGRGRDAIRWGPEDLTPPSSGEPLGPGSPLHPDYAA